MNSSSVISGKSDIMELANRCITSHKTGGLPTLLEEVNKRILLNKIRFPLIEYCGELLYKAIPENDYLAFCDGITNLRTISGNVLVATFLQIRLKEYYWQSIKKASD